MSFKPPVGPESIDGGEAVAKTAAGPAPVDPAAFADAHRQLLSDSAIQFNLPDYQPPEAPQFSAVPIPFMQVVFWIVVAAIVLFLLYHIGKRLADRDWSRRRREEEAAAETWRPEAAEARELLGEADALAAEGRYSEAARLILLRSIEDIDEKRPDTVRPALTSRDICALETIPSRPRSAFARIAMMVERSLFAGRPLLSGDWTACRAAYEEFAFAEGWRG